MLTGKSVLSAAPSCCCECEGEVTGCVSGRCQGAQGQVSPSCQSRALLLLRAAPVRLNPSEQRRAMEMAGAVWWSRNLMKSHAKCAYAFCILSWQECPPFFNWFWSIHREGHPHNRQRRFIPSCSSSKIGHTYLKISMEYSEYSTHRGYFLWLEYLKQYLLIM